MTETVFASTPEAQKKYAMIRETTIEFAENFVYLIPAIAEEVPPDVLDVIYTLHTDPHRASQKHFEDRYIAQYADIRSPLLWRFFTIWAYILMTCSVIASNIEENDDAENDTVPIVYTCADKAIMWGDAIATGYIKAWVMYYVYCTYLEGDFINIDDALAPGLAQGHIEHIYLRAKIYCNESEYDEALPYLLALADAHHVQGIRLFIKEYIHNPDHPPHYKFLGQLKAQTYAARLKAYLVHPPADVAAFLEKKATGTIGACPVCYEDTPLILHDCRETTHAICVLCYCKTYKRCPVCRFSQGETKKRLCDCLW